MRKGQRSKRALLAAAIAAVLTLSAATQASRTGLPTMGGMQLWADIHYLGGWRIQHNVVTDRYRLLDDGDHRRAAGTRAECEVALEKARASHGLAQESSHAVVLLHGLGRRRAMFKQMEHRLSAEGYEVVSVSYPSTRRSVEDHAAQVEDLLAALEGIDEVSFVTHSLGGIVVQHVLERHGSWQEDITPRKFIMLGTPNQGATLARRAPDWIAEPVLGTVVETLRTPATGSFGSEVEAVGIIAGGRKGKGYNPLIPGDDDGVVGVAETRLDEVNQFLLVPGLHGFLPANPAVIEATVQFLASGEFSA